MDSVHEWMGALFYRRIDPSRMGYTDLRYYYRWHLVIAETELTEAQRIAAAATGK